LVGGYKSIDRSDSLLTYVQSLNTTKRALDAEVSEHLGDDKNAPVINPAGNARNGKSKKTLTGRAIVFKL
jgi:transposase-like protein